MNDYASLTQEILDAEERPPAIRFSPRWVRESIARSDGWMEELELLNLSKTEEASLELRNDVADLAMDVGVAGSDDALVERQPIPLLDLVFEIQEALFELGGYRQLWVKREEEGWL